MTRSQFVITATDTGIGKTVFASALTQWLDGCYWKPVQAGLDDETDREVVARLSGVRARQILPEAYRLATPCSPHRAAEIDGISIDPARLAVPTTQRPLVIEGAGGALVPLGGTLLFADIFALWSIPVIIVASTRLGTINHSLLTLESLRVRNVAVLGIVFVGDADAAAESAITEIGNVSHLGRLPILDPLDKVTLGGAFAAHIRTDILS